MNWGKSLVQMSLCTVSLSVNDIETIKKPTHIVMWQDESVTSLVSGLTGRIEQLEKIVASLTQPKSTPLISGIDMKRRIDSTECFSAALPTSEATTALFKELISTPIDLMDKTKTITFIPRMGQDSAMYSITPPESIEVDEEEEEGTEEEEEEEEAEEAMELEMFEYKGVTYYKDSELQVYQLDSDGDIDETAIGIWSEEKQKLLKYAKA